MTMPFLENKADVGQVYRKLGRVVVTHPGILSWGLESEGVDERYVIQRKGDIGQGDDREDYEANVWRLWELPASRLVIQPGHGAMALEGQRSSRAEEVFLASI